MKAGSCSYRIEGLNGVSSGLKQVQHKPDSFPPEEGNLFLLLDPAPPCVCMEESALTDFSGMLPARSHTSVCPVSSSSSSSPSKTMGSCC